MRKQLVTKKVVTVIPIRTHLEIKDREFTKTMIIERISPSEKRIYSGYKESTDIEEEIRWTEMHLALLKEAKIIK